MRIQYLCNGLQNPLNQFHSQEHSQTIINLNFIKMNKKLHHSIAFITLQIAMMMISSLGFAQTGYIYLHKNATDENSSPNFPFNVTGPSGFNKNYLLNDQHPTNFVRDVGATGNGGLWALAGDVSGTNGYDMYYKSADAAAWIQLSGAEATRIDGGPGNANVHVNNAGIVFYYPGSGTTQNDLGATDAVDVAFDKSGTNRVFYVNSSNEVFFRNVTSGSWTKGAGFTLTGIAPTRIDAAPNGLLIYNGGTNYRNVYTSDYQGGSLVSLGSPTGASVQDVAVGDDGIIYAVTGAVVYRYTGGYVAGGSWIAEPTSQNSINITGGNGGQVWSSAGGQANTIWSRTTSGFWIDDESVLVANNNSVLIPVTPGTYVVSEGATANWSLGAIDVYDPTNNSTADVNTAKTSVNVAANEVVHVVYRNFLIQTFAVNNNCSDASYLETFGTGTSVTLGGPLTGQTSYHHVSNPAQFMNDGYYMVASRSSQADPNSAVFGNYPDHTSGNGTGRMMLVNASYDQGEFFRRRFINLLPGTEYSFSAWVLNIANFLRPNVRFEVNDPTTGNNLANISTGDITTVGVWVQHQLKFTATQSEVDVVLRNNNLGGRGNDLALDDISFSLAKPLQPVVGATNATCPTGRGSLTVTSPLGASIVYSIDGTTYQANPVFTNVLPGSYTVTASFANSIGCVSTPATVSLLSSCPPTATDDKSLLNTSGTNVTINILPNDLLSDGTQATITNTSVALTATGVTGAVVSNGGLRLTVPGQGIWNYITTTGSLSFAAEVGFKGDPTPITYELMQTSTGLTSSAKVTVTYIILPVTLVSFTATKSESSAKLNWGTTWETNSEKFEVQHSIDAKKWSVIATVAAKGESNALLSYHYTHVNPIHGENLYRLKMIDFDATFAYSRIVSLNFEQGLQLSVFPNPATDLIKVKLDGISNWEEIEDVKIIDLSGKIVYISKKMINGEIHVSQLPVGAYIVSLTTRAGLVRNAKIIIKE
jgi:hypothetical protein